MRDGNRERVFLSHIMSLLIDQRQSIGVGILAETQLDALCAHALANGGQVFGGRFGHVLELPIRRRSDQDGLTAQFIQQSLAEQAARSVI
jgi:hypothetical protein